MAEWLGNRAINEKVAGSIPGSAEITLCPWARHFTLLASGACPCTYCKSQWIRSLLNVTKCKCGSFKLSFWAMTLLTYCMVFLISFRPHGLLVWFHCSLPAQGH